MKQEPRPKSVHQHKALTPPMSAKNKSLAAPAISPPKDETRRIYMNAQGQLAVSDAGFRKIQKTFMGSSVDSDSNLRDCTDLENVRFGEAAGALPYAKGKSGTPEALSVALDAVASLAPRDGMEVMLCSQLVALHSQGMEFLRRGMIPEQTVDGVDCNVSRATKLFRTFATMADCLRSYRGGGHQRVTVEHVTVQAGGQAVVGTVHRAAGGGDANKNCG